MGDRDLSDAVARKTGEDSKEIQRRGFTLTGPDDTGPEPECLLDVLLVDLDELGTVDWESLPYGCQAPFFKPSTSAYRRLRNSRNGEVSGLEMGRASDCGRRTGIMPGPTTSCWIGRRKVGRSVC